MGTNRLTERICTDPTINLMRGLRDAGQLPFFRAMESATTSTVRCESRSRIMLGSNNYLGLADHPEVRGAAQAAVAKFGTTNTGSRLLNGTIDLHTELEAELADWHGAEDAIVFTSGYQANVGTIGALVGEGDTVIVDSDAHASIHDGSGLCRGHRVKFAHNDTDELRTRLSAAAAVDSPALVVVDGLYSMEGDLAPLDRIAALCGEFGAALMVDEAHSVGVMGDNRTGAAEYHGVDHRVDVRMGTLSKGLGSVGGFVVGSRDVVDALRIRARAYLFTTSGVPASIGAALAAIRIVRSAEGAERAQRVIANARHLRAALVSAGLDVGGVSRTPAGGEFVSPILPIRVGDDLRAAALWNDLFGHDVFTSVAVYPAVARDGAILRLCVTAGHSIAELDTAAEQIADVFAAAVQAA